MGEGSSEGTKVMLVSSWRCAKKRTRTDANFEELTSVQAEILAFVRRQNSVSNSSGPISASRSMLFSNFGWRTFWAAERNGYTTPDCVLVDFVASALPRKLESLLLQHCDNLARRNPWELRHQRETSTVDRLNDFGSVSSSWPACRSSRCRRIASLILLTASS